MNETIPSATASENFRPLKWNELVKRGDYVKDGHGGFEPWAGPAGFRADAFVRQVYRKQPRPPGAEKPVE